MDLIPPSTSFSLPPSLPLSLPSLTFVSSFVCSLILLKRNQAQAPDHYFSCILKLFLLATENISLLAFLVSWNSPSDSKDQLFNANRIIPMANHTRCGCRCIAKPSDCDPSTQVFSQDNCRCECRAKSRPCPSYHRWDRIRCKCVCHPPSYITCPRRFQWSPEKCKCVCKTSACRANKVRNQKNCRCYCPRFPICPLGFRKNRRTCKCILDV